MDDEDDDSVVAEVVEEEVLESDVESDEDYSAVEGDDDDYVDIDSDSEEDMRSSFPRDNCSKKNLIAGGPQARDTTGMTESEKEEVKEEDKKLRKKWTNAQRWLHLKKYSVGTPPPNWMGYCGDQLRTLDEVEKHNLSVGQMFPKRDIFWLRIAEEALLRGITVRAIRSEVAHLTVCGPSFHAEGSYREGRRIGIYMQGRCCPRR